VTPGRREVSLLARPEFQAALEASRPRRVGHVTAILGLSLTVSGLDAAVGQIVLVGDARLAAQVVSAAPETLVCMPLESSSTAIVVGDTATLTLAPPSIPVGPELLGRVIDGLGRPIDGKGPLTAPGRVSVENRAPEPMERTRITQPLQVGVRAMDTLLTLGRGQRIGLFAGSGVGKSSLLSMIARGTDAAVSVIALIGERGREVGEFIDDDLGPEGLSRSVVVVATSDEPALMRLRAARAATRIAEWFRDAGRHAMLMMDSLTRVAMAQREIGLSAGEPPATRGYPPSTFSMLAGLLERAGTAATGSVTGIYTVLVDGDDHDEPIADAARSVLDGHVVLDRRLSTAGHFPPIDVLASISRLASKVTRPDRVATARTVRRMLSERRRAQDLLDVGAYKLGTNRWVDAALAIEESLDSFLQQGLAERSTAEEAWRAMTALAAAAPDAGSSVAYAPDADSTGGSVLTVRSAAEGARR
jgi:flagellum-specific ATP synthase